MTQDEDQLRLLTVFHYVVAGMAALCALFPIIHLIVGLIFIFAPPQMTGTGTPPPAFMGWFFVAFATVFIITGWVFAGFIFAAARFLGKRKHYMFCVVMAGIECLFMPFGTVLGVFTLVVLMRESVKQLFVRVP